MKRIVRFKPWNIPFADLDSRTAFYLGLKLQQLRVNRLEVNGYNELVICPDLEDVIHVLRSENSYEEDFLINLDQYEESEIKQLGKDTEDFELWEFSDEYQGFIIAYGQASPMIDPLDLIDDPRGSFAEDFYSGQYQKDLIQFWQE